MFVSPSVLFWQEINIVGNSKKIRSKGIRAGFIMEAPLEVVLLALIAFNNFDTKHIVTESSLLVCDFYPNSSQSRPALTYCDGNRVSCFGGKQVQVIRVESRSGIGDDVFEFGDTCGIAQL